MGTLFSASGIGFQPVISQGIQNGRLETYLVLVLSEAVLVLVIEAASYPTAVASRRYCLEAFIPAVTKQRFARSNESSTSTSTASLSTSTIYQSLLRSGRARWVTTRSRRGLLFPPLQP